MALSIVLGTLLLNGSLQHIWSSVNALQLIAFLAINNFYLHYYLMKAFSSLIGIVTFDFLQIFEALEIDWGIDGIETTAYNENFESLGIEVSNTT